MEFGEQRLMTLRELARALLLPAAWLKAEAVAGRIPCLRAGRRLLFNADAVARILLQRAAEVSGGERARR